MSLRVLIATPLYPPEVGGPATFSEFLARELPRRGVKVACAAFRDVRHLPPLARHAAYARLVFRKARSADIVFAQDPLGIGFPAWFAAALSGRRFLLKVVGDRAWEAFAARRAPDAFIPVDAFQGHWWGVRVALRRAVQSFVARRAEAVIVPSEFLAGIVRAWGVPRERIRLVHNGFAPPAARAAREDARRAYRLPRGVVVVSAGRLVPWKGFAGLIEAFARVARRRPDASLFIAGDGPSRGSLERAARERGVGKRVSFLGAVPRETLFHYIAAADAFALNTGYEGLSHQLLEVMALGTPILTTAVGGNPEMIEDGVSGLLVGYNDIDGLARSLERLCGDAALREDLARAARERLVAFSEERAARGIMDALTGRA